MRNKKRVFYTFGFLFLMGAFVYEGVHFVLNKKKLSHQIKMDGDMKNQVGLFSLEKRSVEKTVIHLAKETKIKKIMSIGFDPSSKALQLEWEATLRSTALFLNALQQEQWGSAINRLQIMPSKNNRQTVIARSSILLNQSPPLKKKKLSEDQLVYLTNSTPFFPIWNPTNNTVRHSQWLAKKTARQREKQRQRLIEEREKEHQATRLEKKKKQLETQWVVTGIVNNGQEPMAFVKPSKSEETFMVRAGDSIYEAKVMSIDEGRGEVAIDYQGEFQVRLKLQ